MYFCRIIKNEVYLRMDSWVRIVTKCLDPYVVGLSSIQIAIGTLINCLGPFTKHVTLHVFVFMFWLKHAFASKEIGTMRAKHEPSSVAHKAKAGERYQANSEQKRADERQRDLE